MRLRRVEAVRYGAFSDAALGEFGDGLNVVLGRNEAGKSTFTTLVRHILYGFPRGRTNERLYRPPGGEQRVGRLCFADEDGESWVVERIEGAHGGTVTVYGPQGEASGEPFLEPLTRGVPSAVFQSVFGFSLDELSDLGSLVDIQSRLYATATGLRVNPHDVLTTLRGRAEELWAPRAHTKEIHQLNKDLKGVREERRRLEETAETFRTDRERRSAVAALLERAEEDVREARMADERLAARLAEARRLGETIREGNEAVRAQRNEAERMMEEATALEIDEGLLAAGEGVDRLGARCELFSSEAKLLREDQTHLRDLDHDLLRRAAELGEGWSVDSAAAFELGVELENHLDEAEERIRVSRRERDECARRATETRAEHREAVRSAQELSESLGLGGEEDPEAATGLRQETTDRLIAIAGAAQPEAVSWFPGAVAAAIAAVIAGAGLAMGDSRLAFAGVLPGLLAVYLLWRTWMISRRRTPSEAEALLPVLGLDHLPDPGRLMEMRHALQTCGQAWTAARELGRQAAAREEAAREAAERLDRLWKEWLGWLEGNGLRTPSDQPASVRRLIRQLRELKAKVEARGELEAQIARRRASCEDFVGQARGFGIVLEGADVVAAFEEVEHQVRNLVARLSLARRIEETRRDLDAARKLAEERASAAQARIDEAGKELAALLEGLGGEEDASVADLAAAAAVARKRAAEVEEERDGLFEERATLDGKLQRGAAESASSELRLREAGLVERLAQALERYAVSQVAAHMLEESLQAYEAERQPEVIRRAQEVFAALTGERYTRLATPLGRFAPSVGGDSSAVKDPEQLSRATAEQLFLALRLSYIENLAGAHPALPVLMDDVLVNFDDERRQAAVRVIADFANSRQVIFFTCHRATIEVFAEAVGDAGFLELG